MRLVCTFVAFVLMTSATWAADLFNDGKVVDFSKGQVLDATTTIGGYPIYKDDGAWRLLFVGSNMASTQGDAESIKFGQATMLQINPSGAPVGVLTVVVNLTNTGQNQYMLGEPCQGAHLVTLKKGAGLYDNCMTVDLESAKQLGAAGSMFTIKVTQTRSGGRAYIMQLRLVAEDLGFPGTEVADWSEDRLRTDKDKAALVQRLKVWGEKLQDAAGRAVEFSKPADAFAAVPPYRSGLSE